MFEHLRQRLGASGEPGRNRKEPVILEELQPGAISGINLNWTSHFNTPALRLHLQEFPGLTLRVQGTPDYIVGDNWRRRPEIGHITESSSRLYRSNLVEGLLQQFQQRGYRAVIVGQDEQNANSKFYEDAGFEELERIVYYEKPDIS